MRRAHIILIVLLVGLGPWATSLEAQVEGRIRRVGLFEGASPLVRSGNSTFVHVELRCLDSKPFDGELRVEQSDRDGDVAISVLEVPLAPDGEWRPFEVYFTPNTIGSGDRLRVKLYDAEGRLVKMRTDTGEQVTEILSDPYYNIAAEDLLILDLTTPKKMPHIAWLDSQQGGTIGKVNNRVVRFLSPQELPRRWQGLEAVDAIAWDDADSSVLSQQQIDALINWVKSGGRLLITSGKNWQNLSSSPLASVLPVSITGVSQENEVQEFSKDIVKDNNYGAWLDKHYDRNPITRCKMAPFSNRPDVIGIPAKDTGLKRIAYRRLLGRGSLTFVGASLHELLPPPKNSVDIENLEDDNVKKFHRICDKVVARNFLALPKVHPDESNFGGLTVDHNLFDYVRDTIGFQTVGAAFLIFAILFAVVYSGIAAWGTYWYLKRRAWEHLCWSAFALASIAGIVIGTGMVWVLRGVTTKLWQTTVIDAKAGDDDAYAHCMLGVKTPDHTRLDLRLPLGSESDENRRSLGFLRVMPQSTSIGYDETKYVASDNYRSTRDGSLLEGVPVRATLKEFQGFWHGALPGTLDAKLVVNDENRFGKGSYIRNRLGITLRKCFILEGRNELGAAAQTINCLYLGDLPAFGDGADVEDRILIERLYHKPDPNRAPDDPPVLFKNYELLLTGMVKEWRRHLPGLSALTRTGTTNTPRLKPEAEYASLLLLSIFDLMEKEDANSRQKILRSHGRSLGCAHQITPKTAILIGYSNEPPSPVLEVNRSNLSPEKSLTIYRFVIPVERP